MLGPYWKLYEKNIEQITFREHLQLLNANKYFSTDWIIKSDVLANASPIKTIFKQHYWSGYSIFCLYLWKYLRHYWLWWKVSIWWCSSHARYSIYICYVTLPLAALSYRVIKDMDMAFVEVCLRMLLVFVLSWTIFHVNNRKKKKATKLADLATEERKEGGPDVIIVGAGVGGSALAYALAKVRKITGQFFVHVFTNGRITTRHFFFFP